MVIELGSESLARISKFYDSNDFEHNFIKRESKTGYP